MPGSCDKFLCAGKGEAPHHVADSGLAALKSAGRAFRRQVMAESRGKSSARHLARVL
jgi:hypothetical protein